ncbi:MAG TPA: hypothetical protein VFK22_01060 [Candidatus Dormibacteraeota bacterium]|nr:hypothetical protein [Candidatus Dormibacteraeota bacterium]
MLLSLRDGSVQSSATVGSDPVAVIESADGRTAYVADSAPGDVYAVGLPDLKIRWKSHTGGAPFGLLLHLGRLYTSLYDLGEIAELAPSTGRILAYDKAPGHPAALSTDTNGDVAVAAGSAFGIALVGTTVWTADYRRSLLMTVDGSKQVPLPIPVHPFWLAPGASDTLLIAGEGESEDSDPGAVFSYDVVAGKFTTLARPRDPDQVVASGSTIFVASHGDRETLAIEGSTVHHWASGAAAVAVAPDPSENLLIVALNSHE